MNAVTALNILDLCSFGVSLSFLRILKEQVRCTGFESSISDNLACRLGEQFKLEKDKESFWKVDCFLGNIALLLTSLAE